MKPESNAHSGLGKRVGRAVNAWMAAHPLVGGFAFSAAVNLTVLAVLGPFAKSSRGGLEALPFEVLLGGLICWRWIVRKASVQSTAETSCDARNVGLDCSNLSASRTCKVIYVAGAAGHGTVVFAMVALASTATGAAAAHWAIPISVGLGVVWMVVVWTRVRNVALTIDGGCVSIRNVYRRFTLAADDVISVSIGRAGPNGPYLNGAEKVLVLTAKISGLRIPLIASYQNGDADRLKAEVEERLRAGSTSPRQSPTSGPVDE